MTPPLVHLNYPLDKIRLQSIAKSAYINSAPYSDPRFEGQIDTWLISRHNDSYINQIMDDLKIKAKPRFYWTEANTSIPEHIDYNTTCSLNFVLSENPAPVTIEGKDYFYTQCVLNTTLLHSVNNNNFERILLKLSVFDVSYDQVLKIIPEKYKSIN